MRLITLYKKIISNPIAVLALLVSISIGLYYFNPLDKEGVSKFVYFIIVIIYSSQLLFKGRFKKPCLNC